MARTTIQAQYTDSDGLQERLSSLLQSKGYENINEKNENVWKRDIGFCTVLKYIKFEFTENNTIRISGWIRPAHGREESLTGMVDAILKTQVINVIKEMQSLIK